MTAPASALSRVVFSSSKSDWRTPRDLFERLNRQWGPFDLDAAADGENHLCEQWMGLPEDALENDWSKVASRVFVNPPYGRGVLYAWVKKAYEESLKGVRVVMLLPDRRDQAWYHDFVKPHAFHEEPLRGRLKFSGAKAGAPFPSVVIVFEAQET